MILINLLPHREAKRQARKRAFFTGIGLAALAGVGLLVFAFGVLEQMAAAQRTRNGLLASSVRALDDKIKDIATLKSDIEALKARQRAVEDLQTDRNVPVYLLNELVEQTPEGVYLVGIRQSGNVVSISGVAMSNERVSEFLRNTANKSPWLERPELGEIKSTSIQQGKDQRKLFAFSMRVSIKRPQGPGDGNSRSPGQSPKRADVRLLSQTNPLS